MSSFNFYELLEDVSSGDPSEIAKKRQQQKQADVQKQPPQQKQAAQKQGIQQAKQNQQIRPQKKQEARKPAEAKPQEQRQASQRGGRAATLASRETREAPTETDVSAADNAGFEERAIKEARRGRGHFKRYVPPKTGRQFDRHSGTGRGKEIKKEGGGGHNWGRPVNEKPLLKGDEVTVTMAIEEEIYPPRTPVETEEKPAAEEATGETAEKPDEAKPAEEEEDNLLTYDHLLEEKKKAKAKLPKPRKANEADVDPSLLKGHKVEKQEEHDDVIKIQGVDVKLGKKHNKSKKNQKKVQNLKEFFGNDKQAIEAIDSASKWKNEAEGRVERGGRRGGRGGRGSRGGTGRGRGRGRGSSEPLPSFDE